MPKRVTSLQGPSRRHYVRATQLLSKKYCNSFELLGTLPYRDLNLRSSAPGMNALLLNQVAGKNITKNKYVQYIQI